MSLSSRSTEEEENNRNKIISHFGFVSTSIMEMENNEKLEIVIPLPVFTTTTSWMAIHV